MPRPSPHLGGRRGAVHGEDVRAKPKQRPMRSEAALSPLRFGRVAQRCGVSAVWPPMGVPPKPSSSIRAYPNTMLRALRSKGHFLWVTFLLGQQKKSDSSGGSRSKRPLRRRHAGGIATTEAQSHWIPAYAGMTNLGWPATQSSATPGPPDKNHTIKAPSAPAPATPPTPSSPLSPPAPTCP